MTGNEENIGNQFQDAAPDHLAASTPEEQAELKQKIEKIANQIKRITHDAVHSVETQRQQTPDEPLILLIAGDRSEISHVMLTINVVDKLQRNGHSVTLADNTPKNQLSKYSNEKHGTPLENHDDDPRHSFLAMREHPYTAPITSGLLAEYIHQNQINAKPAGAARKPIFDDKVREDALLENDEDTNHAQTQAQEIVSEKLKNWDPLETGRIETLAENLHMLDEVLKISQSQAHSDIVILFSDTYSMIGTDVYQYYGNPDNEELMSPSSEGIFALAQKQNLSYEGILLRDTVRKTKYDKDKTVPPEIMDVKLEDGKQNCTYEEYFPDSDIITVREVEYLTQSTHVIIPHTEENEIKYIDNLAQHFPWLTELLNGQSMEQIYERQEQELLALQEEKLSPRNVNDSSPE